MKARQRRSKTPVETNFHGSSFRLRHSREDVHYPQQIVRFGLVKFGERHDTRTTGSITAADRRPTNQVWQSERGSHPRSILEDVGRVGEDVTRMLQGSYEETAPVELKLNSIDVTSYTTPLRLPRLYSCTLPTCRSILRQFQPKDHTHVTSRYDTQLAVMSGRHVACLGLNRIRPNPTRLSNPTVGCLFRSRGILFW